MSDGDRGGFQAHLAIFLARGPVADMESEPTAASVPAEISVPARMRSALLDRPGLSRNAGATL